mmetsp:Transcript_10016/g.32632  ORF Transcript_10016/g.32632 Transcript_10016/m.32632 type:complete len:303 (+) Transcript_10016:528-1436(+)
MELEGVPAEPCGVVWFLFEEFDGPGGGVDADGEVGDLVLECGEVPEDERRVPEQHDGPEGPEDVEPPVEGHADEVLVLGEQLECQGLLGMARRVFGGDIAHYHHHWSRRRRRRERHLMMMGAAAADLLLCSLLLVFVGDEPSYSSRSVGEAVVVAAAGGGVVEGAGLVRGAVGLEALWVESRGGDDLEPRARGVPGDGAVEGVGLVLVVARAAPDGLRGPLAPGGVDLREHFLIARGAIRRRRLGLYEGHARHQDPALPVPSGLRDDELRQQGRSDRSDRSAAGAPLVVVVVGLLLLLRRRA